MVSDENLAAELLKIIRAEAEEHPTGLAAKWLEQADEAARTIELPDGTKSVLHHCYVPGGEE
jgi:hypothetical protein